jgi:putative ABC transport system permease protein
LVSFTVANRTKEIGVRKVLGANSSQIVTLLSKDFISLIVMALVISISATYFVIQSWLERYAFRIELSGWLFVIPAAGVLLISLLTIFIKTFQVSTANPVKALKDE